jgi:uncharacterized membrane protein
MPHLDAARKPWQRVTQTFLIGVFGILPLAITFAVLAWLVVFLHDLAGPYSTIGKVFRSAGMGVIACDVTAYMLGLVITLLLVYGLGVIIESGIGHRWHTVLDATMRRVPLLNTVYDASKNLTSVFDRKNNSLQGMTPVMCYFGADGAAAVPALMPTSELVRFQGNEYHVVIIPTAPVPFGGALLCVKAEWVKPATCSFDELIGIYVSMGYSAPKCLGPSDHSEAGRSPVRLGSP